MRSMMNDDEINETESECPQCKKRYFSSQSNLEQTSSEQQIVIPIKRQLLNQKNGEFERIVSNLQAEISALKNANSNKDSMISNLKFQFDQKIRNFELQAEIKKQNQSISQLRIEIEKNNYSSSSYIKKQNHSEILKNVVREEIKNGYLNPLTERSAQVTPYSQFSKQFLPLSPSSKYKAKYCEHNERKMKCKDTKQTVQSLKKQLKQQQEEILWMKNFITCYIGAIQRIWWDREHAQILVPEWSLQKKAKVSWKYMKDMFTSCGYLTKII